MKLFLRHKKIYYLFFTLKNLPLDITSLFIMQ